MSGASTAKTRSATPDTTLRLPLSAHSPSGTAHSSCATEATKATAPSPLSLRWNDFSRLLPTRLMPLPNMLGTMAARVRKTSGV